MRTQHLALGTLGIAGSLLVLAACGGGDKKVYFGNLTDGANVESPFKVEMKAENLIVEPASMGVNEGHGHFHILLDVPLAPPSGPIAKDAAHLHYGNGQTEAVLDLPVGQHTLVLEFAKGDHVPYDPPIYQQITVNVIKRNVIDSSAKAKPADSAAAKTDTTAKAGDSAGADTAKAKPAQAKPAAVKAKHPAGAAKKNGK